MQLTETQNIARADMAADAARALVRMLDTPDQGRVARYSTTLRDGAILTMTLRAPRVVRVATAPDQVESELLARTTQAVLEVVRQAGQEVTPLQVSKAVDINNKTVSNILGRLARRGDIRRSARGTYVAR